MKKNVPSGYFSKLLFLLAFVAIFATGNLFAQEPGNCNIMSTIPARGCAGSVNIYSAAMNPASNGQTLNWTIPVNQTGAFFTNGVGANLGVTISTICHATVIDEANTVLVNVGSSAGSLKVEMLIQGQGEVGGCNSSRTVRKVQVTGEPGKVICHDEKGCIQFTASTQSAVGGAFIPSPPYLYTLQETGEQNGTGLFCNLTPGIAYHVNAREVVIGDLNTCDAVSDGVSIVNPPVVPVTLTCPLPFSKSACLFPDRASVQTAFNLWLTQYTKGGGTGTITVTTVPAIPTLPEKIECGGKVTVVFNAIDECKQTATCSSTFEIVAASVINPTYPGDREVDACDVIDLNVLRNIIEAYEAEFSVGTGGCDPKITFDPYIDPLNICDATINITGKITDKCDVSLPFLRHLIIKPPVPVEYKAPAEDIKDACYYKDQAAIQAAYELWLQGFYVNPATGCRPTLSLNPPPAPNYCGGIVDVKAFVNDKCITQRELNGRFGVRDATPPVFSECNPGGDLKCNPDVIPGAVEPKVTSLCTYKVVPTVVDSHVDCFYKRVITYVVSTDCFKDADTCVTTWTWKQDKEGPIITGLEDKTIPGGDEENGLCTPTTTVGGKSIPDLKTSGSVKASWDFSQPRLGNAPTEILDWTNGTTSAGTDKYFEGMSVPQRILISGIKAGKHTVVVSAKAVKKQDDARHGYDFLTSWDQAIVAAGNIGPDGRNELINLNKQECDGHWSGAGEAACRSLIVSKKAALPPTQGNPPNQTGITNVDDAIKCYEAIYGPRTLEMEALPGTTISSLSVKFLGYTGREEGDNWALYEISWDSSSTTVEIKVAGHLAVGGGSCGYGNCHGAGDIKGNPYHIRLDAIDGSNPGARDNQVKCEKSQTCDVNIPVKFDTPKATDCDPAVVIPTIVAGKEDVITVLPDGSVRHCRTWEAYDACLNRSEKTQCITVVCVLGANFGERRLGYVAPTSKSVYDTIGNEDIAITKFVAYPNPFRNAVSFDLQTNSTEQVRLDVYDMLGKQLDQRVTTPGEINSLQLGERYPTGIYNLILNQATEQRTIRLLKQ